MAQSSSVTISPSTGSMLAGVAGGYNEYGVQRGWSSMWQHEQLPLVMNVSDFPTLTEEGKQLANPAGNMSAVGDDQIVVMGGQKYDSYMTVALPKGFRITGYKAEILNNVNGEEVNDMSISSVAKTFYETNSEFEIDNDKYKAKTDLMPASNDAKVYTISRESTGTSAADEDMGSILYFRIHRESDDFYGITIKSFTVYFTAEADFTESVAPVRPTDVNSVGASFVNYPFATQKIDVGELNTKYFSDTQQTYLVYDYSHVKDLNANVVLFEDDAVSTSGVVGENGNKGITSTRNGDNYYYALKKNVYYVEAPTNAVTQDGKNVNIAYRITGAKIKYNYGTANDAYDYEYQVPYEETTTEGPYTNYLIVAKGKNGIKYYLTGDGGASVNGGQLVVWDGDYIRLASENGTYYLTDTRTYSGGSRYAEFTTDKTKAKKLIYDSWDEVFYYQEGGNNYYLRFSSANAGFRFQSNSSYLAYLAIPTSGGTTTFTHTETKYRTEKVGIPAFTPTNYTINVYDAETGTKVVSTANVSSSNKTGEVVLKVNDNKHKINNDAFKFEIVMPDNAPADAKALITVELTMQALNPYLSRLDITCHDPNNVTTLTQQFNAENFAVRGGAFTFFVPAGFDNKKDGNGNVIATEQECSFTFDNMYTPYLDNTYYDGEGIGHGRNYMVNSEYEIANPSAYSNPATKPDANYTTKISVTTSGTKKFTFNNAEQLDHSSISVNNVKYEEYPFSKNTYQTQGGNFEELKLKNQGTAIRYLFCSDEPRYNISLAKATEHRSYAFYVMNIKLITKTYYPDHEWKKLYDETCYYDNGDATKPMYGLVLATSDKNEDGKMGYLTIEQVDRIINNNDKAEYYGTESSYTPKNDRPADLKDLSQILYVDGSDLHSIVYSKSEDVDELRDMKNVLGANVLFFLPEGMSSDLDNVAIKDGDTFRSTNNIILTDRKPFYTPYDIQVDGANYASYTRQITWNSDWEYTKLATVILPFKLNVTNGVHEEPAAFVEGTQMKQSSFSLSYMDAMSHDKEVTDHLVNYNQPGKAHFTPISGSQSEANKPYLVQMTRNAAGNIPFTATQYGALVVSTSNGGKYLGESCSGKIAANSYVFQNNGTYCGIVLNAHNEDDDDAPGYFYFGNGKFLNSKNLRKGKNQVYVYPFRGYYSYSVDGQAKAVSALDITFDMDDIADGIENIENRPDMLVKTGKGVITVGATTDNQIRIYGLDGMNIISDNLNSGDERTYTVPSGIYVVNGVKVIVK